MSATAKPQGNVRIGVGGWIFKPWRDNFYPASWPQSRELEFASRRLGAIEVNSTYYGLQKPATFARWRAETPDDFVFTLKASRFATNRRVLAEAGESIQRFVQSGISELGDRLGPIVWQLAPTKRFDPVDLEGFFKLLPAKADGAVLRHALEVRHESFHSPDYLALARRYKVSTVFTDSDEYPSFADITGGFVYVRTMRTNAELRDGVSPKALAHLATCARAWRGGGDPYGVPHIEAKNIEDAIFLQGYVTAQDRLWQMDAARRLASGELSEVAGAPTLESDRDARRFRLRRIADQQAQAMPTSLVRRVCHESRK